MNCSKGNLRCNTHILNQRYKPFFYISDNDLKRGHPSVEKNDRGHLDDSKPNLNISLQII